MSLVPLLETSAIHAANLTVLALALGFAGCTSNAPADKTAGRIMLIGGDGYIVEQLTAGTWTAIPQTTGAAPKTFANKAALLSAIEEASGCKVTDSDYSQGGKQLDAQVNCPGPTN